MSPDYRKTALERRDGCIAAALLLLIIVVAGGWLGTAYVAAHFILKYW